MPASNVLRVNATEERDSYREAVANILRAVQCEEACTLLDIAESIDVSLGTISNAANKKNDLCPTYLLRLGKRYGAHCLTPFAALAGGIVQVARPEAANDLQTAAGLSTASAAIIEALFDGRRDHRETCTIADLFRQLLPKMQGIVAEADQIRGAA